MDSMVDHRSAAAQVHTGIARRHEESGGDGMAIVMMDQRWEPIGSGYKRFPHVDVALANLDADGLARVAAVIEGEIGRRAEMIGGRSGV